MSRDFGENTYTKNSRHKIKIFFHTQNIVMHTFNSNLHYYFEYLPPHEQLKEINKMIAYFSKNASCYHNNKKNTLSKIVSLKDIKKDILSRMHTQM